MTPATACFMWTASNGVRGMSGRWLWSIFFLALCRAPLVRARETLPTASLLTQQLGGGFYQCRFLLERLRYSYDFLIRLGVAFEFNAFPHAGNCLHFVSAVDSGSIEHMLVPRAAGKAVIIRQLP